MKPLEQIPKLVSEFLLEINSSIDDPLATALLNPGSGQLQRIVREARGIGRRQLETQRVATLLEKNKITTDVIAKRVGRDRTTVERLLSGKTVSKWWDDLLFTHFADQLRELKTPSADEKFIAGYCYAIESLRNDVANLLDETPPSQPPITDENFCYLWHMLCCEPWQFAMREQGEGLLEEAAASVFSRVTDARNHPSYPSNHRKSPLTLIRIHENWGLWFRIVLFCSNDVEHVPFAITSLESNK